MKPLPLTAEMALAAILGEKTETRRPIPKRLHLHECGRVAYPMDNSPEARAKEQEPGWQYTFNGCLYQCAASDIPQAIRDIAAPFGLPGTELWLREPGRVGECLDEWDGCKVTIQYASDKASRTLIFPNRLMIGELKTMLPLWAMRCVGIPNGIFREAARYKTVVLAVRVERLWEITEAGAIAEGVEEAVKSWLLKYQPKWEPQCWLSHDHGESYCRRCAEKEAWKLRREGKDVEVDGGWSLASIESDVFEECTSCGKLLETSVHDPSDYLPFDGVHDGYLTAEEIAMVYNFGEHSLSLKEGYAREAYRVLWDMIYGKRPGLAWADNPWVSVTAWGSMVAI
ncbi:hypothetical protein SAMN04488503_2258 [Humidesulfovibrio mexicanus]|uniref:Uncharacterized protein n=1 Tax=Humidesulfovibrio mexicanus TaxID=147047 RepID=A0A239AWQ9_9BACT|nr:hypothetical protein [Humidesulfovibrio mexicanus]SNR99791.1 hypothetical protein SAMN04488503_2258 [Humidesulfovibrio mexicanus]